MAGIVNVVEVQALCFFCGPGYLHAVCYLLFRRSASGASGKEIRHSGAFQHRHDRSAAVGRHGLGAVVESLGVQATIIMAGGLEALFSIWMLSVPFWRNFRFTPDDCPEGA
ncbi:hypothetical protein [Akkermansia sp.]|uniref:hypothetical protein n=1 Tax=Akkermansia sp. TaxID=1872421 RepID=UPI00399587CB